MMEDDGSADGSEWRGMAAITVGGLSLLLWCVPKTKNIGCTDSIDIDVLVFSYLSLYLN
jgi:hypothetical protein